MQAREVPLPSWQRRAERFHQGRYDRKDAWTKVRDNAKVVGRWHDNRHRLVMILAEAGAGTILTIDDDCAI